MVYLGELHKHSEDFKLFTENGGVGKKEIQDFNRVL